MSDPSTTQVEPRNISTSLEVEQLDVNLFRSITGHLHRPYKARGVFGGQVISQALVSATKCVDPAFALHSVHAYFLLSAAQDPPIIYHVDRVRDGRSFVTRSVKAVQYGRTIFIMLCSFQRPEPWQPTHQWPMPTDVPHPDDCELEETVAQRAADAEGIDPQMRQYLLSRADAARESALAIKQAAVRTTSNGSQVYMIWFKAKNIEKYEASFQKCILSYVSDSRFIGVAVRTLGLSANAEGPKKLAMSSSLDHSIHYYDNDFDCGEWFLYVITSPRTGSGRGVVHGRMYTLSGKLIAVTSQEGLIRADVRDPTIIAPPSQPAKL